MMESVRCSLLIGSCCNISGLFHSLKVLPRQRLHVILRPPCALQTRGRGDCYYNKPSLSLSCTKGTLIWVWQLWKMVSYLSKCNLSLKILHLYLKSYNRCLLCFFTLNSNPSSFCCHPFFFRTIIVNDESHLLPRCTSGVSHLSHSFIQFRVRRVYLGPGCRSWKHNKWRDSEAK